MLIVLVAVVAALVVGVAGVVAGLRLATRHAAAERAAALRVAQEALAAERHATVQAAVDTAVAVAGQTFADHSSAATSQLDLRSEVMTDQFRDLNEELRRVRHVVAELQRERAEQHGRLEHGLSEALRASTTLTHTTQALREALASTKARGQWGERMAEDVLRAAGFVEGVNYRKQTAVPGGGIPDFTFLLPRQRVLHMDVKFPLDNYLRAAEAATARERAACEAAFLKDVRQRVKEIAGRGYVDPERTVEAVLLFIPNEAIYGFIHEHDPQLADVALGQQVVLCSPFTLFAVLAVVRQSVDAFMVERTSDEVLRCLGSFSGQWDKFSASLDVLGKRFESAQKAYDDVAGTRRRQLQRSLDQVDELRARRGIAPGDLDEAPAVAGPPAQEAPVAADGTPLRPAVPRLHPIRLR